MTVSRDESYLTALKDTHAELQRIRSTGNWLVVASICAAVFLYLGAGLAALAYFGADKLGQAEPIWFFAAFAILTGPAVAIVMAGVLARQSRQSGQANALVLRASQMLLMPAEQTGSRINVLATQVKSETSKIDETIENTHASLADLKQTLELERRSLSEFVEQNRSSLADMLLKLSDERQALAELSAAVEAQTAAISEAIPRQARTMAEAARLAQQEVAKADLAVDERLQALDESGRLLGEKLAMLGDMSVEAEERSSRLAKNIDHIATQIQASARTVDTAVRAGEMASTAATETSDALSAAVSSALDGTREASEFIRKQSREAVAETLKAMAELKSAGESAEAATKAASEAARIEADRTEKRIQELSESLYAAATRATSTAEQGLERARQRIERASALLNGLYDGEAPQAAAFQQPTSYHPPEEPAQPQQPTLRPRFPEELTEQLDHIQQRSKPAATPQAPTQEPPAPTPSATKQQSSPEPSAPTSSAKPDDEGYDMDDDTTVSLFDVAFDRATQKEMGLTWKDLLSGLEAEPEERDEAARYILAEIEDAGVPLDEAFNARETRKISGAARKSDRHRQRAVREFAGTGVRTLQYRLEDDPRFKASAERFVKTEAKDSIQSLSEAERSRTEAPSRLSAYLLLDAAFAGLQD